MINAPIVNYVVGYYPERGSSFTDKIMSISYEVKHSPIKSELLAVRSYAGDLLKFDLISMRYTIHTTVTGFHGTSEVALVEHGRIPMVLDNCDKISIEYDSVEDVLITFNKLFMPAGELASVDY